MTVRCVGTGRVRTSERSLSPELCILVTVLTVGDSGVHVGKVRHHERVDDLASRRYGVSKSAWAVEGVEIDQSLIGQSSQVSRSSPMK